MMMCFRCPCCCCGRLEVLTLAAIVAIVFASWILAPLPLPDRAHFSTERLFGPASLFEAANNYRVDSELVSLNVFAELLPFHAQGDARNETKSDECGADDGECRGTTRTSVIYLLHGMPESARISWDATASLLERSQKLSGKRLILCAFDLRGFNESQVRAEFQELRSSYSVDYSVLDLGTVHAAVLHRFHLNKESVDVHLVSHDLGALVAWAAWQRSALEGAIKSVTVVNVPHTRSYWEVLVCSDQLLRSWYILFFQLPQWIVEPKLSANDHALFQWTYTSTRPRTFYVGDLDDLVAMWSSPGKLYQMLNYYRALLFAPSCRYGFALDESCFSSVAKAPINLIWGLDDWVFASEKMLCASGDTASQIAALTGDSDFVVRLFPLAGVNHYVPAEFPELIASVVEEEIAHSWATRSEEPSLAHRFIDNKYCAKLGGSPS